jgi:hypothetical protein
MAKTLSDGVGQRSYLITSGGAVSVIDAFRESGKITMAGAGAADTVNGGVTSVSSTAIIDSAATRYVSAKRRGSQRVHLVR